MSQQHKLQDVEAATSSSTFIIRQPSVAGSQRTSIDFVALASSPENFPSSFEQSLQALPESYPGNIQEISVVPNKKTRVYPETQSYSSITKRRNDTPRMQIASSDVKVTNQSCESLHVTRFYCSRCPDFFLFKSNCVRHFKTYHRTQKLEFPCELCSASFKSKAAKTLHLKRAHRYNDLRHL